MKLGKFICLALLLAIAGCTGPSPEPPKAKVDSVQADPKLLEPLLLKEQPPMEKVQTVIDIRKNAKDGDEVLMQGKVPPGNLKPFLDGLAGFSLMAAEDLEDPAIKEEFDCEDGAT